MKLNYFIITKTGARYLYSDLDRALNDCDIDIINPTFKRTIDGATQEYNMEVQQ